MKQRVNKQHTVLEVNSYLLYTYPEQRQEVLNYGNNGGLCPSTDERLETLMDIGIILMKIRLIAITHFQALSVIASCIHVRALINKTRGHFKHHRPSILHSL